MESHDRLRKVSQGSRRARDLASASSLLLGAALMPAGAAIALASSSAMRKAATDRFAPALGEDASRRAAVVWAVGLGMLAVGQAIGAAAGPMSMMNGLGLALHTAFALCGELVMLSATIVVGRRRPAPATAAGDVSRAL